ncbi:YqzL-like protein, partial [Dysosmobacter welbionis]
GAHFTIRRAVGVSVGGYVQAVHGREICKRRARGLPRA